MHDVRFWVIFVTEILPYLGTAQTFKNRYTCQFWGLGQSLYHSGKNFFISEVKCVLACLIRESEREKIQNVRGESFRMAKKFWSI